MNKLLIVMFAKLILLFAPCVAVVFTLLYFGERYLIEHGLKQILFIPGVVAIGIALWLSHLIVGSDLAEIKKLHVARKNRTGPSV